MKSKITNKIKKNKRGVISELPEYWIYIETKVISELLRGISYKKEQSFNFYKEGLKPILRANNITNAKLNFDDLVYIPKSLIKEEQLIRKNDILFAMSSGSKHLVGKSAIAHEDFDGSFGAFCALLRVNNFISSVYISYFFNANKFRKFISEISSGTNINNLKREHILDFSIPLPPSRTTRHCGSNRGTLQPAGQRD
ncbi:restriction endonuclease subunit S [Calditrichota bacterium GD2]